MTTDAVTLKKEFTAKKGLKLVWVIIKFKTLKPSSANLDILYWADLSPQRLPYYTETTARKWSEQTPKT